MSPLKLFLADLSRTKGLRTLLSMRTHNPKHAHRSSQYQNRARTTQCPKCGRKSALTRRNLAPDVVVACRWTVQGLCDYVLME